MGEREQSEAVLEGTAEPDSHGVWTRTTAPQTPYSMRQVGTGLVMFVILAIVAFGLPLAFA